ncbi:hypothetical protein Hanom_Chr11g01020671 [Helianthus anomalus]
MSLTFSCRFDCLDSKLTYLNFSIGEERITYELEPCDYHKNDDSWTCCHFWKSKSIPPCIMCMSLWTLWKE